MSASLKVGRFAGIKVQIHWTFWLLFLFVGFMVFANEGSISELIWNFIFVFALFFCVVLHEFGHSLTARKFGIGTRSITLLPIGGLASLEEMPENPLEEFYIAIAGPLVNVVIALLLFPFASVESYIGQDPEVVQQQLSAINAGNFLFYLFFVNVALVLFNMLPAFPMDGGRIFRALLSMKYGRIKATKMASGLGKFMALLFFLFGLFYSIILTVIAVFIWFGAHSENIMIQQLSLLEGNDVRDAMITEFSILRPDAPLSAAIEKILATTERNFIVATDDTIHGILYMEDLSNALKEKGKEAEIRDVMNPNFVTLNANDSLTVGYRKLARGSKNFYPVTENERIVGVLDMDNINEFLTFRASTNY